MKSYDQQIKEIRQLINKGTKGERIVSREVIAEDEKHILVRSVDAYMDSSKNWQTSCNYELWSEKSRFLMDKPKEYKNGQHFIYMIRMSSSNEHLLMDAFHSHLMCSEP